MNEAMENAPKKEGVEDRVSKLREGGYIEDEVDVFMEKLGDNTVVFAVYKEGPTVEHPAEEGEILTVEEYDLDNDKIPLHGGNSELFKVYTNREEADSAAE